MELKDQKEISVGPTPVLVTKLAQALEDTQRWLDDLVSPFARAKHDQQKSKPG